MKNAGGMVRFSSALWLRVCALLACTLSGLYNVISESPRELSSSSLSVSLSKAKDVASSSSLPCNSQRLWRSVRLLQFSTFPNVPQTFLVFRWFKSATRFVYWVASEPESSFIATRVKSSREEENTLFMRCNKSISSYTANSFMTPNRIKQCQEFYNSPNTSLVCGVCSPKNKQRARRQ